MSRLLERFTRAMDGFDAQVQQIRDDQWDNDTPCTEWSVRDLLNHVVSELRWGPHILGGGTIEEAAGRFDGDQLGADPKRAWRDAADGIRKALSEPGVLDRKVHVSWGVIPAHQYMFQMFTDQLIHAWDLARGIDADDRLDPELVTYLYEKMAPRKEQIATWAAFADPIDPPEDADTQTKLLALYGRRAF